MHLTQTFCLPEDQLLGTRQALWDQVPSTHLVPAADPHHSLIWLPTSYALPLSRRTTVLEVPLLAP